MENEEHHEHKERHHYKEHDKEKEHHKDKEHHKEKDHHKYKEHHKEYQEYKEDKDDCKEDEKRKEEKEYKDHKEHYEEKRSDDYKEEGEKETGGKGMESNEEKWEGLKMDGIHLKKRDLWLVAGGALGALAMLGLGKVSKKVRPAAVGAVREGYAFKEWLAGKAEKAKEDVEDIVAEGVYQYKTDLAATADSVQREKTILEKIEKVVEEKLAKMKPEQGEG